LHLRIGEASEAHEGSRIGDDQLRAAQPNKGDKHADAAGRRVLQAARNAVDDLLAHARHSEQHEEHAGEKHGAQSRAPGDVHGDAHGVSEISVERHSRGQGDWVVGVQAHYERSDGRCDAGGKDHPIRRNSGLRENLGVHHNDVRHREEGGDAAEQFAANGGLVGS